MATTYSIHPAIGIARVGNSPDEFFIGPERLGEYPEPQGGFKDAQCRVKRQVARFRILAHHDDGTVDEIDDSSADITWTVHLVNKKAANPGRGNSESAADLVIDPGSRTLSGPNQRELFDNGQIRFSGASAVTVPLGEIRSDTDNHLLVFGGSGAAESPLNTGLGSFWGNEDWYDDVADGPVTAAIKLNSDNSEPTVVGAWVIVAPPKFAPHQDSVITLYDRIQQAMIDAGLLAAPTTTAYTKDVYPILQRARDTRWVEGLGAGLHAWPHPVNDPGLRSSIFSRITAPADSSVDMPQLLESASDDGRLTPTQYAHMQRWEAGTYADDWTGVPEPQADITRDGLDRAALEACVGGAFFPGIEAGGRSPSERPILDAANYAVAFRLNQSVVAPGDISYTMALPWQADFNACGDGWWPVPRPNDVFVQGQVSPVRWDRPSGSYEFMVAKWHELGFIVQQGNEHVEVDRCESPSVSLLTPSLDFANVPQGPLGMVREMPLAITFEVISPDVPVTLEYAPAGAPLHPQLLAINNSVTVGPTAPNAVATARFWIVFQTAAIGAIPQQTVTVRDPGSTVQWTIAIDGNTVAHNTGAAALVLDRSGSMSDDRGDGQSKHKSLQEAANIFVDVMLEGDGAGIVRYNQDAQVLQNIRKLGSGGLSDVARGDTHDVINGNQLDPDGNTSIGDGIAAGRDILNNAPDPYDVKSLVVLTDGLENSALYIEDVAASINQNTYAIGFGTPENTSAAALQTISGNHGGFLLVTGAITQNNRFLLQKYFLQILAGVSNAEVVLDPEGTLRRGQVHRIPFTLTSSDAGVDVILLTPETKVIDFRLQTPSGLLIEPWRARAEPGMRYVLSDGVTYYRIVLPTQLQLNRFDRGGTWHALLTLGRPRLKPTPDSEGGVDLSILRSRDVAAVRRLSAQREIEAVRRAEVERLAALSVADTPAAGSEYVVADSNFAVAAPSVVSVVATSPALPYSVIVHAYSSISMRARIQQSGYAPGATVRLEATLTESGIPAPDGSVLVSAQITRPDASTFDVTLQAKGTGQFVHEETVHDPGVFRIRVLARGSNRRGERYTREQTLTASVWLGGDKNGVRDDGLIDAIRDSDERFCKILQCLLRDGVVSQELEQRLEHAGIDLDTVRRCVKRYCASSEHSREPRLRG